MCVLRKGAAAAASASLVKELRPIGAKAPDATTIGRAPACAFRTRCLFFFLFWLLREGDFGEVVAGEKETQGGACNSVQNGRRNAIVCLVVFLWARCTRAYKTRRASCSSLLLVPPLFACIFIYLF